MKFLKYIIQNWRKEEKKILGRWNIDYCDVKMSKKIDLSNEDHCGPCGQYIKDKIKLKIKDNKYIKKNNI